MNAELTIIKAGWSVVQDLGRTGLSQYGIVRGGAADQYSARAANALVGNAAVQPLIECTVHGLAFVADVPLLMAVTGAPCDVRISDVIQPAWRPLVVPAGSLVELRDIRHGLRAYVALNGMIDVASVLGSVAPDAGLGIGRALIDGECLRLTSRFGNFSHPATGIPLFLPRVTVPSFGSPWTIDVVDGPDMDDFGESGALLFREDYVVNPNSDTVGLRLTGAAPIRGLNDEIVSRGVAIGSIEVPPSGELLVLQRGRMLTAGYPLIAVASTSGQSWLGQAVPGDTLRFRRSTLNDARDAARRQRTDLHKTAQAVATALQSCGLTGVITSM
jgi:biotin-dependent carboxylase-like uncharacterized protein